MRLKSSIVNSPSKRERLDNEGYREIGKGEETEKVGYKRWATTTLMTLHSFQAGQPIYESMESLNDGSRQRVQIFEEASAQGVLNLLTAGQHNLQ